MRNNKVDYSFEIGYQQGKENGIEEFIKIAKQIADSGEHLYFNEIMEKAKKQMNL